MPDESKPSRNQRRKLARAAVDAAKTPAPPPAEVVRRRRRLIFLGVLALLFPLLEVVAYQFRSILVVVVNKSDAIVRDVKFTYPGGSFEAAELKPGAEVTHNARPNYSFQSSNFSTYWATISVRTPDDGFIRQMGRTGTIDYSARETYAIQADEAPEQQIPIGPAGPPGAGAVAPQVTIKQANPLGAAAPKLAIKHTTHPGFPLGTIRDLLDRVMGR